MEAGDEGSLGPYHLIEKIGAGGMGEVWKAEDTRLRRLVALKILPNVLAADPESKARLIREARTAAQLYHPNIATIHSIEEADGRSFIVMELVDGESLGTMLRRGPLTEAEVVLIARQVADALGEAHARNIVHRDIKPDNIIVAANRVKVLDFGIAKQSGFQGSPSAGPTGFVTEAGVILGTIQYMSPEQALGRPLDGRSDIFSLGVVMYQCLSGQMPFAGDTVTETLTQIIRDNPRDLKTLVPSISASIAAVILKCMAKDRDARYGTAQLLSQELELLRPTAATIRKPVVLPVAGPAILGDLPTEITKVRAASKSRKIGSWLAIPLAVLAGVAIASFYQSRHAPPSVGRVVPPPQAPPYAVAASPSANPVAGTVVDVAPAAIVKSSTTAAFLSRDSDRSTAARKTRAEEPSVKPKPAVTDRPPVARPYTRREEALVFYEEGMAAVRERRPVPAAVAFGSAVKKDPEFGRAWLRLGQISLRGGNRSASERAYLEALRNSGDLDPREVELADIGLAASRGEMERTRQLVEQFQMAHPGDDEIRPYVKGLREAERSSDGPRHPGFRRRGRRN